MSNAVTVHVLDRRRQAQDIVPVRPRMLDVQRAADHDFKPRYSWTAPGMYSLVYDRRRMLFTSFHELLFLSRL